MKIMRWFCKKFGHKGFTTIDKILVDMGIIEIKSTGKTDINLICQRCKQKFSVQKIYELTHDGVERTNEEVFRLAETSE